MRQVPLDEKVRVANLALVESAKAGVKFDHSHACGFVCRDLLIDEDE